MHKQTLKPKGQNRSFRGEAGKTRLNVQNQKVNAYFSMVTWNISGLLGKLLDNEVTAYLRKFDFICLQETFLLYDFNTSIKFPNHKVLQSHASKPSKAGRPSGGVLLLYKKNIEKEVTVIDTEIRNVLQLG